VSMTRVLLVVMSMMLLGGIFAQGTVFIPKVGLVAGVSNFSNSQSLPLISYHASLAFEEYEEGAKNSFFGQIGLHNRGSNVRVIVPLGINTARDSRQNISLTNISGQVGLKSRINSESAKRPYYSFGIRGEYTLSNNFASFEELAGFLPLEPFINKWNYGATLAFGYEFEFSELFGGIIEASVHPDLSIQYNQQQSISITAPINGQTVTLPRRQVRNVTFEISFGLRLINKVVYIN